MNHPTDPDCIFCKIIAGQIPAYQLYQDPHVLAFLDVGPIAPGHTLIIPKAHYPTLDTMPPNLAAHCIKIAPTLIKAIQKATGATALNLLQNNGAIAGQAVNHVHFHLIPRTKNDAFKYTWPAQNLKETQGLALLEKIKKHLNT